MRDLTNDHFLYEAKREGKVMRNVYNTEVCSFPLASWYISNHLKIYQQISFQNFHPKDANIIY